MKHLIAVCLLTSGVPILADTAPALAERFDERLESKRANVIELRRDLHRHPEVSENERRTAGVVAARLEGLGFSVKTGVGGHGVVAILNGGKPGPLVAFRADMDAVPSNAPDPVPFKSVNVGVRHIYGHDIHTTIGLALAEGFAAVRDDLQGSVMLVFQPAEENAIGARAMLADGALRNPKPDAIFAFHTAPMPVGQLVTSTGTLMSWRDRVTIKLSGDGDLESAARKVRAALNGISTISQAQAGAPASGDFLQAQSGAPSRNGDGTWSVGGVITTATDAASDAARSKMKQFLAQLETSQVDAEMIYEKRWIAGVTNDPTLTEKAIKSARAVLSDDSVATTTVVYPTFSEDFGSFQQVVPGTMFFLGVSNPEKGWVGMPHSPDYVADEESIFVGARTMAAVLFDFLKDSSR